MRIQTKYLSVYPWHSINVLPHLACVGVCEDDYPYKLNGSLIEVVVFGYVIHLHIPFNLPNMSTRAYGPLWSKSKHKWYRAPK